jgi:predicted ABC-type ATPase
MPVLYILAGPNGVGKTTYYDTAIEQGFIDTKLPFLNVDIITRFELGGYSEENYAIADAIFRKRIGEYINDAKDFMIESNLARDADYDWVQNMIKKGYDVILYFLCTNDIEVNINRVLKRVKEGGHDVPANIIENRYNLALLYLRSKMHLFKKCFLIDNTAEVPITMAIVTAGVIETKSPDCYKWVNNVLYILDRKK